jgi:enoyl-CoA hydratase
MLAEKSRPGLAYIKEMIRAGQDMSAEEGLRSELETMNAYASSTDLFEGLSAFREKRKPRFLDR